MTDRPQLVSGGVGRRLTMMTLPMVAGMFAHVTFNLTDTYFVSRLGTRALAAISFTFPVVMVVGALALGLGAGTATAVSRAIGASDTSGARRLTTDSLLLGGVLVLALAAAGIATIDPVFRLLGATDDQLGMIREYMVIWYIGSVFLMVPMVGNNAIRATGDALWPGMIMALAAGVNIVLDPIFIFGWGPVPAMGLRGAAIATVFSRALTMAASLGVLHWRRKLLSFERPTLRRMLASWRAVLYVGVPTAATTLLWPLSMGVVLRLVAGYGEWAVAAVGAASRVEGFVMMVIWSLATTLLPFVGQNRAAGRMDRVRRARRLGDLFAAAWGIASVGVFWAVGRRIAMLFSDVPAVVDVTYLYLLVLSLGYALRGICILAPSTFNALHRPVLAAGVNILRMFCLYIPLAYLGMLWFGVGGIFAGLTAGNVVAGIVAWVLVNHTLRREDAAVAAMAADAPQGELPA